MTTDVCGIISLDRLETFFSAETRQIPHDAVFYLESVVRFLVRKL